MAESKTPVVERPAAESPVTVPAPSSAPGPGGGKKGKAPATHEQKQKRRKQLRRGIALVTAVAVLGGSAVLLKKYVFQGNDSGVGEVMTDIVSRGSIQSKVAGYGTVRAKNSATVTPEANYTVYELFIKEGDKVEEGQLLYNLDDTAAQEAIRTAQESLRKDQEQMSEYQDELADLYEDLDSLTITAPHDGKLTEVNKAIKVGSDLTPGTAVATLVNDTKLRLHLYYSYAYEGQFQVGQQAQITLPALMNSYPGTVEQVNYVRRILPEGSVAFEVVFLLDNPGTLTEGMTASAQLTGTAGEAYPYESGELEYYESTSVTVKVAGPVEQVELMNYADVKAGQVLVVQGDKSVQKDITAKKEQIREFQKTLDKAAEAVEEAEKKLELYHATAPISGTVLSLGGLTVGEQVHSGAAIQIADTTTMVVDIDIDERNIGYASVGMFVDLQDQMGNYYMGTIETIALTAKAENGVATFPATVAVENPLGSLMTNAYVDYSFIASQASDCLVVPLQAVLNVTLPQEEQGDDIDLPAEDGEAADQPGEDLADVDGDEAFISVGEVDEDGVSSDDVAMGGGAVDSLGTTQGSAAFKTPGTATVCYVRGEADERAITADDAWEVPEGFFPVIVTTGLSDESMVEIKSGLNEGDEVFTGYTTDSASSWY